MNVLVIEDDAYSAELLRLRLETLGCQVRQAHDVARARALAREAGLGLIICDLNLAEHPGGGIALVGELRADPATANVPIVVHSVYVNQPSEAPEALPAVEAYLPKPFQFAELRRIVDDVKARQGAA